MNEKIQKLMGKALDSEMRRTWDTMTYGDLLQFSEKFAELIVRECANFVDYRLTNPNGASMAWCDGSDIKEHFGVEE